MKASIIIPALNEEASIGLVLQAIPRDDVAEVIVVDNGSTDRTPEVARDAGARVVTESERGYGAACMRGLSVLGGASEIIVILDGDHSDYPEDLPNLLRPIQSGEADFVLGSRTMDPAGRRALQWNQRLGNAFATTLIHWLYGARFTDMGPFRAVRRSDFLKLEMAERTFGWNAEMQVKAIAHRLRVREVPVRYRSRIGTSKISGTVKGTVLAGLGIIGTILSYYPTYRRMRRGA